MCEPLRTGVLSPRQGPSYRLPDPTRGRVMSSVLEGLRAGSPCNGELTGERRAPPLLEDKKLAAGRMPWAAAAVYWGVRGELRLDRERGRSLPSSAASMVGGDVWGGEDAWRVCIWHVNMPWCKVASSCMGKSIPCHATGSRWS